MKRNDFILLPPSGMDDIRLGLQQAEDLLNAIGDYWSALLPRPISMEESMERERYYYVIKKILRMLGFEYGYYDEKDHGLTYGGKRLWRKLSDDEVRELNERWRQAEKME